MLLRKNDSGRSIVEMLGVLAIMGVITVMGISGYSSAVGKMNRNSVSEKIVQIAQEVRSIFAGQDNYLGGCATGKTGTGANATAALNTCLTNMGMKLDTPYGGTFTVTALGDTGNNPGFKIVFDKVPLADCTQFLGQEWPDAMNSGRSGITKAAYQGSSNATTCATSGTNTINLYYR